MKKTKIISLIMVIAMLVSAFSILSVSAEDADLKFSGATLSIDSDITVYFMVAADALADYDDFYATFKVGDKAEAKTDSYFEHAYAGKNYYMIPCRDVAAKEMNDTITANIYGVNGDNATKGAELTYSVAKYCYNRLNNTESGENMKKLAANLLEYGAAAQTKFEHNTDNLANANMTDAHKAYVTSVDVNSLVSHYENTALDSATVTVSGATMELGNRISVVFVLEGAIDGTTAKLTWDGGEQSVAAANYKTVGSETLVYFNAIDPADYGKVLTMTVYNGETPVSNTVKYSLETYAKNTGSAIALSVLGYCKSAETYIGSDKCLNGHTWTEIVSVDENYNIIDAECSVCGGNRKTGAKALTSEVINTYNPSSATTFPKTYVDSLNAVQYRMSYDVASGYNYVSFGTKTAISLDEYNYMVIYAISNCEVKVGIQVGVQGEANQYTFAKSPEWTAWTIDISSKTGDLGTVRFDPQSLKSGATICVNSIAFFKTEAEAKAFTGFDAKGTCYFGHTYRREALINENYDLTMNSKCTVCGNTNSVTGKGMSAEQLYNGYSKQNADIASSLTNNNTSVKYSCYNHNDAYFCISRGNKDANISFAEYGYMVVYYRSTGWFKLGVTGYTNCNRYHYDSTNGEWTAKVVKLQETSGNLTFRLDWEEKSGRNFEIEINSIAFFKTEADAKAFAGVYGHAYGDMVYEISNTNDLTGVCTCSICGNTKTVSAKGVDASMIKATTPGTDLYSINKDETKHVIQCRNNGTFTDTGTNYIMLATGLTLDGGNNAKYLVIYMSSTCNVKVRPAWGDAQLNTTFTASEDMTAWIIDVSSVTKESLTLRLDPQAHTPGTTITVNSVATFKTLEDAQTFAGIGLN